MFRKLMALLLILALCAPALAEAPVENVVEIGRAHV